MDWNKVSVSSGGRLNKVHSFTYMLGSDSFRFEIDESSDGSFTGHGEHSTDKNYLLKSVAGSTIEECLQQLIDGLSK